MCRCASARTLESFFPKVEKSVTRDARWTTLVNKLIGLQGTLWVRRVSTSRRTKPEWWGCSDHGGGSLCAGFADERSARTKIGYNRYWRHLDLFGVRPYLRYSIRRVRMSAVVEWSEKRCLVADKEVYQELRTRGSVAGTEDGRQRR